MKIILIIFILTLFTGCPKEVRYITPNFEYKPYETLLAEEPNCNDLNDSVKQSYLSHESQNIQQSKVLSYVKCLSDRIEYWQNEYNILSSQIDISTVN